MARDVVHDLATYLPRIALRSDLTERKPRSWELEGSLCFVDVSGFTALSERLARKGRVGAEILTEVLNDVFSRMLGIAYEKGGSLLKFGGDALLLMFSSADHPVQAVQSAVAMRAALRETRTADPAVGQIKLRMSVGIHSGHLNLFRVGESHRELLVCGPGASETVAMEQIAEAGEIVISAATAAALPRGHVGPAKSRGFLLRSRTIVGGGPGAVPVDAVPATSVALGLPVALRDHLAAARAQPEHRLATVAFVKFRGTDALVAEQGPEATALTLDGLISTIQEAVDGERVTFLGSDVDMDGGKVILATGVPLAQDDDEGRMLRAARHIADARTTLSVRIGVNRGHVFAGEIGTEFRRTFTIMGDTVNLAARLMAAAPDGAVYATAEVLERSHAVFDASTVPPFRVKGKSAPVQAFRVGKSTGSHQQRRSSTSFVGRRAELDQLEGAWASALDGQGRVIVIEADRGAGKSRLVDELRSRLLGAPTITIEGAPNGAGTPYRPLRSSLRRLFGVTAEDPDLARRQLDAAVASIDPAAAPLVPLLGPLLGLDLTETVDSAAIAPKFRRDCAFDLVVGLLDALRLGPLHVAIEDAHWLDEATGAFVDRAALAARTRPWLMTVTRRPGASGPRLQAADVLALGPLEEGTARELLEAATAAAPMKPYENDAIIARAAGNPLFVEELVRVARSSGTDALPDTLDAVANAQIDALPPRERQILRHASVLGTSFDRDLLMAVLDKAELDAGPSVLARLGEYLVNDEDNRLRFRHALLREAAYEALPYRRRRELHLQAGEALESLVAPSRRDSADALSLHFSRAHAWPQAWRYARHAGEQAKAMYAPGETVLHLQRAVDAARHLPAETVSEMASVWADLGDAHLLLGDYGLADQAFARAAALSGDDLAAWAGYVDLRVFVRGDHLRLHRSAVRLAHLALARLDGPGGRPVEAARVRLLAREALIRTRQGRFRDALRMCSDVIERATTVGELRALTIAYTVTDECLVRLGRANEAGHLATVVDLHAQLGDEGRAGIAVMNMGAVAFFNGDWHTAETLWVRAVATLRRVGDAANEATCRANLGEMRANQGRFDEAEADLRRADRTYQSLGLAAEQSLVSLHLARVCAATGRDGEALQLAGLAIGSADESGLEVVEAYACLAEAHALAGRAADAMGAVAAARAIVGAGAVGTPVGWQLDRVEALVLAVAGDTVAAMGLIDRSIPAARAAGSYYDLVVLLALRSSLAGAETDTAEELHGLLGRLGIVMLPQVGALSNTQT